MPLPATFRFLAVAIFFVARHVSAAPPDLETRASFRDPICEQIGKAISNASEVYYAGHHKYHSGLKHWASSSSQLSKCVVEPGSAEDVATILRIVGSKRTPFAVKGGGHASNPGFSSTPGVHITMTRFNSVTYNAEAKTVTFGSGLVWDDVYAALEPHGVVVVGGRVSGVGVAGFTLGGGYSWKTNQYGLTIDTVTAYELVKPDGTIVEVTKNSDSNLFMALKGGMNNFGIVTKFTLRTFPQGKVWGGTITYGPLESAKVDAAVAAFSAEVTDPKASLLSTVNVLATGSFTLVILFYDGAAPPPGVFDSFLTIPHLVKDINVRSFLEFIQLSPTQAAAGSRTYFSTVPLLQNSPNLLKVVRNESIYWGTLLALSTGTFFSYDVEPFLPSIYNHNREVTAFPSVRSLGLLPLNILFQWQSPLHDGLFHEAIKQSMQTIYNAAVADGQASIVGAPSYPNYAIFDTPLEQIYGSNLAKLRALKAIVDPNNVMGLAGGFKL